MGMVVGVATVVFTASGSPGTMTLQRTLVLAILCFILGPPELEERTLKRVKDIIDFASKHKLLIESNSDD